MTDVAVWLPPALRDAPRPPDAPPGEPRLLDALLAAVDQQRRRLEADIDQLWDDLFIESCEDWAVPYIGALLGLPADAERLEVAYAIALRRRKGTPGALEDFAEVLTGWTARVIEGWQVTTWAQRLGHPPPPRVASFDMRAADRHRVGTPFERNRRSVTPGGPWSPRAATAVVWPWRVRTYVETEAAPLAVAGAHRFALHPLGADAPLYLRPRPLQLTSDADPAGDAARTGDETDAPVRATYRVLEALAAPGDITYGTTWTIAPTHPLATPAGSDDPPLLRLSAGGTEVPWTSLRFGSLPNGAAAPAPPGAGQAVVDLARGHVELADDLAAAGPLRATWHRPTPGSLGALCADADADPAAPVIVTVNPALVTGSTVVNTIEDAFFRADVLSAALVADGYESQPGRTDVEIRLETSDRLDAPPPQVFTPSLPRWRIVATRGSTPAVVGALDLDLEDGCVVLEGFAVTGDIRLGPTLAGVTLRGITMNPPSGAAVVADPAAWGLSLRAERCLLGAVRADLSAFPLVITDCVVDGRGAAARPCGGDPGGIERDAVAAVARFGPDLHADSVTFVGPVRVEALDAVDCVFVDGVEVVQQQEGCVRFCFLGPVPDPAPGATPSLPPTYRCGPFPPPTFASIGFEAAGYYTLTLEPDHPLLSAASDGGEVGAYHHDRRAARIERLRRRIHEFVPLGLRPLVALAPWEE